MMRRGILIVVMMLLLSAWVVCHVRHSEQDVIPPMTYDDDIRSENPYPQPPKYPIVSPLERFARFFDMPSKKKKEDKTSSRLRYQLKVPSYEIDALTQQPLPGMIRPMMRFFNTTESGSIWTTPPPNITMTSPTRWRSVEGAVSSRWFYKDPEVPAFFLRMNHNFDRNDLALRGGGIYLPDRGVGIFYDDSRDDWKKPNIGVEIRRQF